ncbi:MAG: hypothetical protein K5774_07500 [Clostridia bacterium]|nr:hypothetical protein [Clostridia bacterium]
MTAIRGDDKKDKAGENGYCIEHEEITPDSAYIAAQVYSFNGEMFASLSIHLAKQRWNEEDELIRVACQLAADISSDLGYKDVTV